MRRKVAQRLPQHLLPVSLCSAGHVTVKKHLPQGRVLRRQSRAMSPHKRRKELRRKSSDSSKRYSLLVNCPRDCVTAASVATALTRGSCADPAWRRAAALNLLHQAASEDLPTRPNDTDAAAAYFDTRAGKLPFGRFQHVAFLHAPAFSCEVSFHVAEQAPRQELMFIFAAATLMLSRTRWRTDERDAPGPQQVSRPQFGVRMLSGKASAPIHSAGLPGAPDSRADRRVAAAGADFEHYVGIPHCAAMILQADSSLTTSHWRVISAKCMCGTL